MNVFYRSLSRSIVLIFLGTMLFSCENDINVVKSLQVDESLPIETTTNVESVIVDSGRVRAIIYSPLIDRFEGDLNYIEMKKGVELKFFDSLGFLSSSLKANYAINKPTERIVIVKYNVIATNVNNEKLFTEELIWDQKTKKIYSNVPVTVESADKIIFGDGMIADESFNNWIIKNPRGDIEAQGIGDSDF